MKQFVAIYAVGASRNKVSRALGMQTSILLQVLADETSPEQNAEAIPFSLLSESNKSGLYVAVVNMGSICESKVFPFTVSNQSDINKSIKPGLLEQCSHSIDAFLGLVDTEEGEPTPAYVDQDPK